MINEQNPFGAEIEEVEESTTNQPTDKFAELEEIEDQISQEECVVASP